MVKQVGLRRVRVPLVRTGSEVCLFRRRLKRRLSLLLGYGSLIRTYVQFILAKLRFHRIRPEFNGLFEYEEYISLKGIHDPNEGCEFSAPEINHST